MRKYLEDQMAMKKRTIIVFACTAMLFATVALTACANESDALQTRIDTLHNENVELQTKITSLRTDLERVQADLSRMQNEMQNLLSPPDAADGNDEQAPQPDSQSGALAITYGGEPNIDMTWPLNYGDLVLGLRGNFDELDEDVEIVWRSANESVFTVVTNEEGTSATVTPLTVGSAQLIVTVGDQETRSWVRVT